jgi:hypothetical protein
MNKRIRELAHAAGLPTYNPEGIPTKLEKFAELIIRECSTIADKWVDDTDNGQNYPSELIQQYFGVKE